MEYSASITDQKLLIKKLEILRSSLISPGIRQDVIRQRAMKSEGSNSWVTYMEKILRKYNLPPIMDIFINARSKETWKKIVKEIISEKWKKDISETAATKSTLKHMNHSASFKEAHHSISILNNLDKVRRNNMKLRLMAGTYSLQTIRCHVYKQIPSPQCLLCGYEEETLEHFILQCPVLLAERSHHIIEIINRIPYVYQYR